MLRLGVPASGPPLVIVFDDDGAMLGGFKVRCVRDALHFIATHRRGVSPPVGEDQIIDSGDFPPFHFLGTDAEWAARSADIEEEIAEAKRVAKAKTDARLGKEWMLRFGFTLAESDAQDRIELQNRIVRALAAGATRKQIAEKLSCSTTRIAEIVDRAKRDRDRGLETPIEKYFRESPDLAGAFNFATRKILRRIRDDIDQALLTASAHELRELGHRLGGIPPQNS
jgi:hypothetical protein